MKSDEKSGKKQVIIASCGLSQNEFEMVDDHQAMNEFDVQKTAESKNLYPAIAQGYPTSGFKEITKKDKKR